MDRDNKQILLIILAILGIMLLAMLIGSLFALQTLAADSINESFDGKCPICKKLGVKSKVWVDSWCSSTLMVAIDESYFDEDGNLVTVYKDPNYSTCGAKCSNEHHFQVMYYQDDIKARYSKTMLEHAQKLKRIKEGR